MIIDDLDHYGSIYYVIALFFPYKRAATSFQRHRVVKLVVVTNPSSFNSSHIPLLHTVRVPGTAMMTAMGKVPFLRFFGMIPEPLFFDSSFKCCVQVLGSISRISAPKIGMWILRG